MNKQFFVLGLLIILTACTPSPFIPDTGNQERPDRDTAADLISQGSTWPGSLISLSGDNPDLLVSVKAASGRTIQFKTQNGMALQDVPSQSVDLPDLVLYRNGKLTRQAERGLEVEIRGIRILPGVTQVSILLETQHKDPDQLDASRSRIVAWRDTIAITNTSEIIQSGASVKFEHQFKAAIPAGTASIPTPTDYYRLVVEVRDANHPDDSPRAVFSQEYAFLLENVWSLPLPETLGTSPGAGPDRLVVYACDMFIPPVDERASDRVSRSQFPGFLNEELIPRMIAAFRLQSEGWGFSWHREWAGYRSEEEPETLSVALANGEDWFHGIAPALGNAAISINLSNPYIFDRNTLLHGFTTMFNHELFHNLQRSISLHAGGRGEVNGKGNAWVFFAEGMAVVAESIARPPLENRPATSWDYFYTSKANVFIQENLNRPYAEMGDYYSALYWRFLYEKCGGVTNGVENPGTGMQILRRTLEVLYSKAIVDVDTSEDLVSNLPLVMDRVLAGASCPFQDYNSSLVAFARAIYGLRLREGRCNETGLPGECGLYDPEELYVSPDVTVLQSTGSGLAYSCNDLPPMKAQELGCAVSNQSYRPSIPGLEQDDLAETQSGAETDYVEIALDPQQIPSSFGMDFIEITLDPQENGRPLTIEFQGESNSPARFHVEILLLSVEGEAPKPIDVTSQVPAGVIETVTSPSGRVRYTIPVLDLSAYNRIGLIITRLDAEERLDPAGRYSITGTH